MQELPTTPQTSAMDKIYAMLDDMHETYTDARLAAYLNMTSNAYGKLRRRVTKNVDLERAARIKAMYTKIKDTKPEYAGH